MSNIITARDPGIIAAEINYIKKKVQETVIYASIEIGGKLCEAKSMVSQGEWGRWLEDNVEYSQSTAENLMKLYKEYGGNQESLFDTWTNSETFGKLTYTQHLALLALPFADRKEFAEQNSVEDMSTRQLQQAIKERDDALHAKADAEENLDKAGDKIRALEAELRDTNQELLNAQQVAASAKSSEDAWKEQIEKLQADRRRAEQSEANVLKQLEQAQKELSQAQTKEETVRAELKRAQENPQVPDSMMEQLRKEAEAQAAAKSKGAAKKKLEEIQKELDAAAAQKEILDSRIADLEAKLVAAEKAQKMNDQDLMAVQTLGRQMLSIANSINEHRMSAIFKDENNAKPVNAFLSHILDELRTAFGIKQNGEVS